METIRESIPYGDQRPCQSPTAREAWSCVCAFTRQHFAARDVLPTVAAFIREECGGRSWTATTPDDWRLLVQKFGGEQ